MRLARSYVDAGAGSELLSYLASKVAAQAAGWLEVFDDRCLNRRAGSKYNPILDFEDQRMQMMMVLYTAAAIMDHAAACSLQSPLHSV